jgi:hypothetical protein
MSTSLPIACALDEGGLAGRQAELRAGVLSDAVAVERLPDGYRWRFDDRADLIARLGAVIDAERRCCRFLRFTLSAGADLGAVLLDVTGPPGTRDVLAHWIA